MNNLHFAQLENQAFALMGRMHVILRREIGKVTDIEYMRIDPGYCRYLLNLAAKQPNLDLQQVCARLDEIYFGPEGIFVKTPPKAPLLARREAVAVAPAAPVAAVPLSALLVKKPGSVQADSHDAAVDKSYIGRLR